MTASDNFLLTKSGRQDRLAAVVRFSGADVGALPASTEVAVKLPPNAVLMGGGILPLTIDGGTNPTYNVGIAADADEHAANLAINSTSFKPLALLVPTKYAEATTIYVSNGTGTISGDGDFLLILEYYVEGRSSEVYD